MVVRVDGGGTPPGGMPSGASEQEAQRLRLILEATPSAMLMVDRTGHVVLVNAQAENLFGIGRARLLEMEVEDLIPRRSRAAHHTYRTRYLANPAARPMGAGRDLYGLRGDGTEVPIEIGLNPIRIGNESFVLASVIDISERLATQAALETIGRDSLRRTILASMPCSVVATDLAGRILAANPATEVLLGYPEAELVGAPLSRLYAGDGQREPGDRVLDLPAVATGEERELTYRRRDGSEVPVGEVISPVTDDDGVLTGYLAVGFDITKRVEDRARVAYLASHDSLTGLPNRATLTRHLEDAIREAERKQERVALLLLDVDHFKRVNDSLGHHVGDRLLLGLADRLRRTVQDRDLVARLGGDEFVVVICGLTRIEEVSARVERLAAALPGSVSVDNREVLATASIGCAVFPDHGRTPAHMLKHADIAMYRAKAAGRNNLRWYDASMGADGSDKLVLSTALQQALDRDGELSVAYQPQVDLATGALLGFEALARWTSPALGVVPPDRFIPVAEDSGLIAHLGAQVLRQACRDAVTLREELGLPLRMAVNVSPRQFARSTWLDEVDAALSESGLDPAALELEITEGTLMDDDNDVRLVLHELKSIGTRIVVDDFGQGYSSLAYLTRFPLDKLKIDREFVRRIAATHADAAVIDAILAMSHALGMRVSAEGVETLEQVEYLRARGCDEAQGFYYGEGAPLVDVANRTSRLVPSAHPSTAGAEGRT
ncbi:diguanylate cyclase (GGDEF)-like protein/PAS domain S-box-containing protein [Nocardioides aromaticivorans]|uniref:Diguanylate cyclase (GGDEF)-like protein/PAS domain S-box-containing protein n=1 Tax=Nocardioides aromaticivorans TaxID=200618 RepID=A0A7Y9ZI40_9ACTN|nr:EAL domain-containing protein [Nocardioides aromaticivorans]NYI44738.1 diguanylate cyclase (GGDEF)-like protein/PAS domain S-box-containing protein [Nocardioides aromaticivorans]